MKINYAEEVQYVKRSRPFFDNYLSVNMQCQLIFFFKFVHDFSQKLS